VSHMFGLGLVGRFGGVQPADQDAATFVIPTDADLEVDELGNLPLGNLQALVDCGCVTAMPEVASALAQGDHGPVLERRVSHP
jgi:hypothetical protein